MKFFPFLVLAFVAFLSLQNSNPLAASYNDQPMQSSEKIATSPAPASGANSGTQQVASGANNSTVSAAPQKAAAQTAMTGIMVISMSYISYA
jgi:hypothetical protein